MPCSFHKKHNCHTCILNPSVRSRSRLSASSLRRSIDGQLFFIHWNGDRFTMIIRTDRALLYSREIISCDTLALLLTTHCRPLWLIIGGLVKSMASSSSSSFKANNNISICPRKFMYQTRHVPSLLPSCVVLVVDWLTGIGQWDARRREIVNEWRLLLIFLNFYPKEMPLITSSLLMLIKPWRQSWMTDATVETVMLHCTKWDRRVESACKLAGHKQQGGGERRGSSIPHKYDLQQQQQLLLLPWPATAEATDRHVHIKEKRESEIEIEFSNESYK